MEYEPPHFVLSANLQFPILNFQCLQTSRMISSSTSRRLTPRATDS